jgi:predicted transcriptional regulator
MSFTKISVNLSDEVLQALREMAQRDSITLTEALRRSISTQKFLEDEQRAGKWILIEDPETKEKQRVVFR